MIAPPQIGAVRVVFGEAFLVADQQAACPSPGEMLQPGICFSSALQAMRTGGLSRAAVIAVPFGQADGQVSGSLFDVSLEGGAPKTTPRAGAMSTVTAPRSCRALAGEAPRFILQNRGGLRVVQEQQLVVCGGGAPRPPYRPTMGPIPDVAPVPGVKPTISEPTWPATGTKTISANAIGLASVVSDCPSAAVLRDGMCFADAVAQLNADPSLKEVVMLGVTGQSRPGQVLSDPAQYEVKRRGQKITANKRFFKRTLINPVDECVATGAATFAVAQGPAGLTATPQLQLRCGPPEAPLAMALWEYTGDQVFLATPGRCAPEERLMGANVCFANVIGYLRASGSTEERVVMIETTPNFGASVPLGRATPLKVRAAADFKTFTAEKTDVSQDGIAQPRGCQPATGPDARGVVYDGPQRGRLYRRFMCPPQ
jgi:hypothetical protein